MKCVGRRVDLVVLFQWFRWLQFHVKMQLKRGGKPHRTKEQSSMSQSSEKITTMDWQSRERKLNSAKKKSGFYDIQVFREKKSCFGGPWCKHPRGTKSTPGLGGPISRPSARQFSLFKNAFSASLGHTLHCAALNLKGTIYIHQTSAVILQSAILLRNKERKVPWRR